MAHLTSEVDRNPLGAIEAEVSMVRIPDGKGRTAVV